MEGTNVEDLRIVTIGAPWWQLIVTHHNYWLICLISCYSAGTVQPAAEDGIPAGTVQPAAALSPAVTAADEQQQDDGVAAVLGLAALQEEEELPLHMF